jgi:tripartite-type tricarboxylate transporter receptor subunit TctC
MLLPLPALAQAWPTKPLRLVAASSPGSGVDLVARVIAQKLGEQLGQQAVVDNRAGAGGNLGAEVAARSAPDGYTLFMGTPAHAINAALYRKLGYDLVRDFTPVTLATTGHYVLVVNPSVPAKTVREFVALAKARPGRLTYASAGNGNATHLAGELLRSMAGIDMLHVPYKGSGPALSDVIAGHADLMFANLTAAMPHIRSGRIRALGVTGGARADSARDLPTLAEAGVPGYAVSAWYGVLAPTGTPTEVVARLNAEIARALRAPDTRARLAGDGADPAPGTPAEFGRLIQSEIATWTKVIAQAGIKPE